MGMGDRVEGNDVEEYAPTVCNAGWPTFGEYPICFQEKDDLRLIISCGHIICFVCIWKLRNDCCPFCQKKFKCEKKTFKKVYCS